MADVVRQVIVANLATPFPLGRLSAHIAHASVAGILDQGEWLDNTFQLITEGDPDLRYWMQESFTKAVCKAWGREDMEDIAARARASGIHVSVIEEEGYLTALAIGPADPQALKQFKDLPLL